MRFIVNICRVLTNLKEYSLNFAKENKLFLKSYMIKMRHGFTMGLTILWLTLNSQNIELCPSIGLFSAPLDSDPICYIQNINTNGGGIPHILPAVGDTIADFTLYDVYGNSYNMQDLLENSGKHILLVSGSFT